MLNFLTSISSSILLYVIAGLLTTTVLFGGLLYHEIGKVAESEQALTQAVSVNLSLQNSLDLKDLSCKIDDKVATEFQQQNSIKEDAKNTSLNEIDKLPSVSSIKTIKAGVNNVKPTEKHVVNIDDSIPDDLQRVLDQSYNAGSSSVGTHP